MSLSPVSEGRSFERSSEPWMYRTRKWSRGKLTDPAVNLWPLGSCALPVKNEPIPPPNHPDTCCAGAEAAASSSPSKSTPERQTVLPSDIPSVRLLELARDLSKVLHEGLLRLAPRGVVRRPEDGRRMDGGGDE